MFGMILLAAQMYLPVPGGFAISNGEAEFSRPLYGWHGNDCMANPSKILVWTGDRPKVRLSKYPCDDPAAIPDLGTLEFDTAGKNVDYRYVWGRAEYDIGGDVSLRMVRSADREALLVEATDEIPYSIGGEWTLTGEEKAGAATYFAFDRKGAAGRDGLEEEFARAVSRLERIAKAIEPKTPSAFLNSLVACQLVAADALLEEKAICHGVTGWHCPFSGWRGAYAFIAAGRYEEFKDNARLYFAAQREDGRIPCYPDRDSIYNMNEVFVDAVLRYWLKTRDDGFMREVAYEGIKRHLEWGERTMREEETGLFENWLNAWNTDDKWCNGGAGTIASSYYAYAYGVMAKVASALGMNGDAAAFSARHIEITAKIREFLWDDRLGVWGEYREKSGRKRLVTCPDTSTIYTAIDSLGDAESGLRALAWADGNIPFLYSSNKLPKFYSSCGVYAQENIHLALAYWQCGERAKAWRLFEKSTASAATGVKAGPGILALQLDGNLENRGHVDFGDTVGIFLRAYDEAFSDLAAEDMQAALPEPGAGWGKPEGRGCDYRLPQCTAARFVDISKAFNQNWRTLHERTYSPRIECFDFATWVPRTLTEHGRSWWEALDGTGDVDNVRGGHNVPEKLEWPAANMLDAGAGMLFRLGPENGANAAFVSLYREFPASIEIPLSGKARKIALLTVLSTNPNLDWMEAARLSVRYSDGGGESLSLVPPDNCDDWLNYLQLEPYALNGKAVMFGEREHANLLALDLDGTRELEAIVFECVSTETIAGLLAATLF